jgi:phosphoserine phosphatase
VVSRHLAVIFDFDDTLVPDSTTAFLASRGIDTEDFWGQEARKRLESGYDPPLHYLQLMLAKTASGQPLAGLSVQELTDFGAALDDHYFSGLPDMFDDIRELVSEHRDLTVEFFIVSSGMQELISGSRVVQDHFAGVYACRFGSDEDGTVRDIRRCVTFTEKTRYLFEINKGIEAAASDENPGLVNKDVPPSDRRVPFENMVYVGDGLTDIPCFSLVKRNGGMTFGVFDPTKVKSAQRAIKEFLQAGRTVGTHSPRYGPEDDLGALIRAAVAQRASVVALSGSQAM